MAEGDGVQPWPGKELFPRQTLDRFEGMEARSHERMRQPRGKSALEPVGGAARDLAAGHLLEAPQAGLADSTQGDDFLPGPLSEVFEGTDSGLAQSFRGSCGDSTAPPKRHHWIGGLSRRDFAAQEVLAGPERQEAHAAQNEELFARHGFEAFQRHPDLREGDRRLGWYSTETPDLFRKWTAGDAGGTSWHHLAAEQAIESRQGGGADPWDGPQGFAGNASEVAQRPEPGRGERQGVPGVEPCGQPEARLGMLFLEIREPARTPAGRRAAPPSHRRAHL